MKKSESDSSLGGGAASRSQLIVARVKELGDWRGETLTRIRTLIKQADPEVAEEWKWRGVPVWEHAGIICTGETDQVVKMTFAKGASLEDPSGLVQRQPRRQDQASEWPKSFLNASKMLDGGQHRLALFSYSGTIEWVTAA